MATKPKSPNPPVKRKAPKRTLTFEDVRVAAKGGDKAFEHFAEKTEVPVAE